MPQLTKFEWNWDLMDKKTLTKLRNNEIKTEKLMRERETNFRRFRRPYRGRWGHRCAWRGRCNGPESRTRVCRCFPVSSPISVSRSHSRLSTWRWTPPVPPIPEPPARKESPSPIIWCSYKPIDQLQRSIIIIIVILIFLFSEFGVPNSFSTAQPFFFFSFEFQFWNILSLSPDGTGKRLIPFFILYWNFYFNCEK